MILLKLIKRVFTIHTFVTPKILKYFYVISILFAIAYGALLIGVYLNEGFGLVGVIAGVIGLILTPLFVRVFFELLLIRFKILDELEKLNNKKG